MTFDRFHHAALACALRFLFTSLNIAASSKPSDFLMECRNRFLLSAPRTGAHFVATLYRASAEVCTRVVSARCSLFNQCSFARTRHMPLCRRRHTVTPKFATSDRLTGCHFRARASSPEAFGGIRRRHNDGRLRRSRLPVHVAIAPVDGVSR